MSGDRARRYRERNREKIRAAARERARGVPAKRVADMTPEQIASRRAGVKASNIKRRENGKQRDSHLRAKYGITLVDQQNILARQDGRCAICRTTEWGGMYGTPVIDHCHTTGRVRGILCQWCNVGLGKFDDSPHLLDAANRYLSGLPNDGLSAGLLFGGL